MTSACVVTSSNNVMTSSNFAATSKVYVPRQFGKTLLNKTYASAWDRNPTTPDEQESHGVANSFASPGGVTNVSKFSNIGHANGVDSNNECTDVKGRKLSSNYNGVSDLDGHISTRCGTESSNSGINADTESGKLDNKNSSEDSSSDNFSGGNRQPSLKIKKKVRWVLDNTKSCSSDDEYRPTASLENQKEFIADRKNLDYDALNKVEKNEFRKFTSDLRPFTETSWRSTSFDKYGKINALKKSTDSPRSNSLMDLHQLPSYDDNTLKMNYSSRRPLRYNSPIKYSSQYELNEFDWNNYDTINEPASQIVRATDIPKRLADDAVVRSKKSGASEAKEINLCNSSIYSKDLPDTYRELKLKEKEWLNSNKVSSIETPSVNDLRSSVSRFRSTGELFDGFRNYRDNSSIDLQRTPRTKSKASSRSNSVMASSECLTRAIHDLLRLDEECESEDKGTDERNTETIDRYDDWKVAQSLPRNSMRHASSLLQLSPPSLGNDARFPSPAVKSDLSLHKVPVPERDFSVRESGIAGRDIRESVRQLSKSLDNLKLTMNRMNQVTENNDWMSPLRGNAFSQHTCGPTTTTANVQPSFMTTSMTPKYLDTTSTGMNDSLSGSWSSSSNSLLNPPAFSWSPGVSILKYTASKSPSCVSNQAPLNSTATLSIRSSVVPPDETSWSPLATNSYKIYDNWYPVATYACITSSRNSSSSTINIHTSTLGQSSLATNTITSSIGWSPVATSTVSPNLSWSLLATNTITSSIGWSPVVTSTKTTSSISWSPITTSKVTSISWSPVATNTQTTSSLRSSSHMATNTVTPSLGCSPIVASIVTSSFGWSPLPTSAAIPSLSWSPLATSLVTSSVGMYPSTINTTPLSVNSWSPRQTDSMIAEIIQFKTETPADANLLQSLPYKLESISSETCNIHQRPYANTGTPLAEHQRSAADLNYDEGFIPASSIVHQSPLANKEIAFSSNKSFEVGSNQHNVIIRRPTPTQLVSDVMASLGLTPAHAHTATQQGSHTEQGEKPFLRSANTLEFKTSGDQQVDKILHKSVNGSIGASVSNASILVNSSRAENSVEPSSFRNLSNTNDESINTLKKVITNRWKTEPETADKKTHGLENLSLDEAFNPPRYQWNSNFNDTLSNSSEPMGTQLQSGHRKFSSAFDLSSNPDREYIKPLPEVIYKRKISVSSSGSSDAATDSLSLEGSHRSSRLGSLPNLYPLEGEAYLTDNRNIGWEEGLVVLIDGSIVKRSQQNTNSVIQAV